MILLTLSLGLLPMLVFAVFTAWLRRYKPIPTSILVVVFLWGMIPAAGGAYFLNTLFNIGMLQLTGSAVASELGKISIIAPVVEELLKGLAVALVYFVARQEFDSPLDGLLLGGVAGLGFAAAENTLYIYRNGFIQYGWAGLMSQTILRVILAGWMHAYFSAFTGIGFGWAGTSRKPIHQMAWILSGYAMAVLAHAVHNSVGWLVSGFGGFILGLTLDWLGYGAMFIYILWLLYQEYKLIKRQLREEVMQGLISESQYKSALNPLTLSFARFSGARSVRFYHILGKLAHQKERNEDSTILRREISTLAPHVQ